MKLVIGSDGNTPESPVAKRFGHAEYFIVYNTDNNSYEAFENIDEDHSHNNLLQFPAQGINTFVVGNIGPHAFPLLKENGCNIYLARKMSVAQAAEKYKVGELKELLEPTVKKSVGHHH